MMSRPSSRTSSQPSSACRRRACVTGAPSCQNVPERSSRRPMARIFSICSGVNSKSCDPILREQLLLLQPAHLGLFGRGEGPALLEGAYELVEAAVFLGELCELCLLRSLGLGQTEPPIP